MTDTIIYIWECDKGHRCAISELAMRQSIIEPRCEIVIGLHGRTSNDRYCFPYYEGAFVRCEAPLNHRVGVMND